MKKIKESLVKSLLCQVIKEEITFSRMVELLNEVVADKNSLKDYAIINGIKLKRDNETIDALEHFSFDVANKHFNLPTRAEWEQMLETGSTWDDNKKGRWIGANHAQKEETEFSTFLPAAGYRNYSDGQLYNRGTYGDYWSSSQSGGHAYYLQFYNGNTARMLNGTRSFGFSVRCVAE